MIMKTRQLLPNLSLITSIENMNMEPMNTFKFGILVK
jgi:hypothetical protein